MIKRLCLLLLCATAQADIPNLSPADPTAMSNVPLMYFGVKSCGEYVIWLVYENDIRRIDKDHEPKDMALFMRTLAESHIPGDVAIIKCATSI